MAETLCHSRILAGRETIGSLNFAVPCSATYTEYNPPYKIFIGYFVAYARCSKETEVAE
jgi:hypothetical protein